MISYREEGGGALVFQGGYHSRKTKHVIKVVFQNQAMYARTLLKIRRKEKGVFLATFINFQKKDGGKMKKKHAKTRI